MRQCNARLRALAEEANEAVTWLDSITAESIEEDRLATLDTVRAVGNQLTAKLKALNLYSPPQEDES